MKTTRIHSATVALLTACLLILVGCGEDTLPNKLKGKWGVDFERTMVEIQKNPRYSDSRKEIFALSINKMMEKMAIELTDSALIYHHDENMREIPFTVISWSEDTMKVSGTMGGKEVEITFKLIDNAFLNYKSSPPDGMGFFIWKRV